jgi:hypothetical protein
MIRCTFCEREFLLSEIADAILLKNTTQIALYQFYDKQVHQFLIQDLKNDPIPKTEEPK